MKKIEVGKRIIPSWLIIALLISGIGSGVLAYYAWPRVTKPFEVKEPIEILYYTSELSFFPGETKVFNATVQNHAFMNYSVVLDFQLDDPIYQAVYVTFSDEVYTVIPGQKNLSAWIKVKSNAPAITSSLTIDFKRVSALGDVIPVSSGNSVTIYERTTYVYTHTFSVHNLVEGGATFSTPAREHYSVTSDGTYLKIHCFRDDWRSGHGVGNNIVAVKLNGVPDFPEGVWASTVVNYALGYNGIVESRFNALGPASQIGPYLNSTATLMGDQHSELVLSF